MTMVVSCFTNSYGRFGPQAALDHLPQAGIGWIEMPIRTAGVPAYFGDEPLLTQESDAATVESMRRRMAERHLKLSSCNVTSGNPLTPAVTEITCRKLDIAAQLGASLAVGGAGEAETAGEHRQLLRNLRAIGDHASRLGIVYCFETHPGLCRTPTGMLDAMRQLDHDHLRLNFDTGNILYYNDAVDGNAALLQVIEYVRHVHLKDHNGRAGEWHFPALGAGGAVDFRRVREILSSAGFDGPLSLEIEGIAGEPERSLNDIQTRIEQSVAHLRACGYGVQQPPAPRPLDRS